MPPTVLADLFPVGSHQAVSLGGSAVTLSIPATADGILAQAISQNVRYTLDGSTPTTSKGFVLYAGADPLRIPINPDVTIKVIRVANGAELQWQAVRNG
jgi:hypothetical protein